MSVTASGIDLDLRGVGADEGVVELGQHLGGLLGEVAGEPERGGDGAAVVRHQAGRRIDGDGLDLLGRVVGDRLDIHAALGRGDDGDAAALAVDQQGQIEFLGDVDAVGDVEAVDLLALRPGLDGDQGLAQHLLGSRARTSSIERARRTPPLASGPSSLNLPLPRPPAWICAFTTQSGPGQFLRGLDGFVDAHRGMTGGDGDAEGSKQLLGLIFVNVHGAALKQIGPDEGKRALRGRLASQKSQKSRE